MGCFEKTPMKSLSVVTEIGRVLDADADSYGANLVPWANAAVTIPGLLSIG